MDHVNELGELLRARRDVLRERGVTVEQIAERADLSPSVIYFHLRQQEPYRQSPRRETLKKLAAGFGIPQAKITAAAHEATAQVEGNPLQLLLTARKAELGITIPEIVDGAERLGLKLSSGNVSNILAGRNVNPNVATLRALAAVLDVPLADVQAAAKQARGQFTYRLPRHVEDQLTPERWARVVKLVEAALRVDDE